jgi:hypothetical protein
MAVRQLRCLINSVNNLSTAANFYPQSTKKAVKYYEVERVIAQRIRKSLFVHCNDAGISIMFRSLLWFKIIIYFKPE